MRFRLSWLPLLLLAVLSVPESAQAQDAKPIQLALFPPIQIVPEDESIRGLRLSIYGRNADVTGVDLGIVAHATGDFVGFQSGFAGLVEGDFTGWQHNLVNVTEGRLEGLQSGIYSSAASGEGIQFSFVNQAREFRGLQISFVNFADRLDGVQIGVINIIRENGRFPVFPIVNWGR